MSQREVIIASGVRTAVGGFGGSLKDIPATDLAGAVIAEAVSRAGVEKDSVDHVVMGNVIHSQRQDMYLSRVGALNAGLPESTPALTVNRLCGSGLQAVVSAAQMILLGDADVAVAGGAESMSRVPFWLPSARFGQRLGDGVMVDAVTAGLTCPVIDAHMGITAENVAERWNISREDQDMLAVESHRRAARAIDEGRFESQILPIEIKSRKGSAFFAEDEHVRKEASLEDMARMRPHFKADGTVTAANASGINDGAAALLLMERGRAAGKGVKPLARIAGYAFAAVEPGIMGIGPIPAVTRLMEKSGLNVTDIDLWEVNEAFAAQALAVCRELKLPMDKVNVNGSGISLGHPIGATGGIISVKLIHELHRTGGRFGVATMCIGGGQGIAVLFERL